MTLIADVLLIAGALGAAFYCIVLSRRLSKFTSLEKGMGNAVAVLSVQVDDLTKAMEQAQAVATKSADDLTALTERAETVAGRLELLLASTHDLQTAPPPEAEVRGATRVRRSRRSELGAQQ